MFLVEHLCDDIIHVIVFVFSQPSSENNIFFFIGKLFIACIEFCVRFIVDGIIGFHSHLPLYGILFGNYRTGGGIDFLSKLFKVFMLYNACVRDGCLGVVDHRIALIVGSFKGFMLEADCTLVEFSQPIIEILIYHSRENHLVESSP